MKYLYRCQTMILYGVLTISTGCTPNLWSQLNPDLVPASLTIEATALENGEFQLAGATQLPDQTTLTVAALRYLQPLQPLADNPDPTYVVLDWQTATVQDGQWQTHLDLWQVADDGHYQEAWQPLQKPLDLVVKPEPAVTFIVTVPPGQSLTTLGPELATKGLKIPSQMLRTTVDGDAFLQADISQPLPLPEGRTTPPTDLTTRQNGGWGERYLLVPEPPLPYTLQPEDNRKTTAPPRPEEFMY